LWRPPTQHVIIIIIILVLVVAIRYLSMPLARGEIKTVYCRRRGEMPSAVSPGSGFDHIGSTDKNRVEPTTGRGGRRRRLTTDGGPGPTLPPMTTTTMTVTGI